MEAIRKGAVVYVGLDAFTDPEVASVVGESVFSDLTRLAGRLYKHGIENGLPSLSKKVEQPNIIIYADEFSDLIGQQFKTLINKSGGAGYQMTLYTQTWSDVIAELGDSEITKRQGASVRFQNTIPRNTIAQNCHLIC